MTDYVYDTESYPNFWSCCIKHVATGRRWLFEVSERANNAPAFYWFMRDMQQFRCRMVGFNNIGYDYPVVHQLMKIGPTFTAADAYGVTEAIIGGSGAPMIWPSDYLVRQIDLYKIHHFDNRAKATSLKVLEFNMRSSNIGDLPIRPGFPVPVEMMDDVLRYNSHDVDETEKFLRHSKEKIEFRELLSQQTGVDMINFNDTKIGKKFFEMELEKAVPGITGTYNNPNRTEREVIHLSEVIFPYIEFETPEFSNTLNYLKNCSITETKAPPELEGVSVTLCGFRFDFGVGGIHGSLERQVVTSTDEWLLFDVDVASYYPNLAIKNRLYPQHLSDLFCDIYENLFEQRKKHPKKSAISEMLKLALNGVYGDSNNVWSRCFYDPQYTMAITINGQLLLCLLAEKFMVHTNCRMVQINTDGVTLQVHRDSVDMFRKICTWWENFTGLTLEEAEYAKMIIRDVNNYIAIGKDGKRKRIGAYAYVTASQDPATREVQWHKDHSALVVQKAAEACMVDGVPVEDFIRSHTDAFDFMIKGKVPGGSRLELEDGTPLQKVTRYHIAVDGKALFKVMPPLAKSKDGAERKMAINKGWKVAICDDIRDFDASRIDYRWYVQEASKLVISA